MMNDAVEEADLDRLQKLVGDHMVDLAYTAKTFFKMTRITVVLSKGFDLLVLIFTALLSVSLLQETLPIGWNIALATAAAFLSLFDLLMRLDAKSQTYQATGEAYNNLYKEFREFQKLTLRDDAVPFEKKKTELQRLTERHRELNEMTPSTWDIAYHLLDEEDVLGNVEVTEEEVDRAL